MSRKEKRAGAATVGAHVQKHEQSIARFSLRGEELPMTRRQELMVGAVFVAVGLLIVLSAGVL